MFISYMFSIIEKTLGMTHPSPSDTRPNNLEHWALKNFVVIQFKTICSVLKQILSPFSIKELLELRLVSRSFNCVVLSILICREYVPPMIRLSTYANNRKYLDFESTRRKVWNISTVEASLPESSLVPYISFTHFCLIFSYTPDTFLKYVCGPWTAKVCSLILTHLYGNDCQHILQCLVLPSFPNLRQLECHVKSDSFGDILAIIDEVTVCKSHWSGSFLPCESCGSQEGLRHEQGVSLSIDIERGNKFCWDIINNFTNLKSLTIGFGSGKVLYRNTENLTHGVTPRELEDFCLKLLDQTLIEAQNRENEDSFEESCASICNLFKARRKLSILALLPAFYIEDFFSNLDEFPASLVELQIIIPRNFQMDLMTIGYHYDFMESIGLKFPNVEDLKIINVIYAATFSKDELSNKRQTSISFWFFKKLQFDLCTSSSSSIVLKSEW